MTAESLGPQQQASTYMVTSQAEYLALKEEQRKKDQPYIEYVMAKRVEMVQKEQEQFYAKSKMLEEKTREEQQQIHQTQFEPTPSPGYCMPPTQSPNMPTQTDDPQKNAIKPRKRCAPKEEPTEPPKRPMDINNVMNLPMMAPNSAMIQQQRYMQQDSRSMYPGAMPQMVPMGMPYPGEYAGRELTTQEMQRFHVMRQQQIQLQQQRMSPLMQGATLNSPTYPVSAHQLQQLQQQRPPNGMHPAYAMQHHVRGANPHMDMYFMQQQRMAMQRQQMMQMQNGIPAQPVQQGQPPARQVPKQVHQMPQLGSTVPNQLNQMVANPSAQVPAQTCSTGQPIRVHPPLMVGQQPNAQPTDANEQHLYQFARAQSNSQQMAANNLAYRSQQTYAAAPQGPGSVPPPTYPTHFQNSPQPFPSPHPQQQSHCPTPHSAPTPMTPGQHQAYVNQPVSSNSTPSQAPMPNNPCSVTSPRSVDQHPRSVQSASSNVAQDQQAVFHITTNQPVMSQKSVGQQSVSSPQSEECPLDLCDVPWEQGALDLFGEVNPESYLNMDDLVGDDLHFKDILNSTLVNT